MELSDIDFSIQKIVVILNYKTRQFSITKHCRFHKLDVGTMPKGGFVSFGERNDNHQINFRIVNE
jgi:hypothetical protein